MANPTNINLTKINTRASAVRALKALGFEKQAMTMTRGTVTYAAHGVSICLAPENFMALDLNRAARESDTDLGFIPALMHVGNTADGAHSRLAFLINSMLEAGVVSHGDEIPLFGMAVGIAALAMRRAAVAA